MSINNAVFVWEDDVEDGVPIKKTVFGDYKYRIKHKDGGTAYPNGLYCIAMNSSPWPRMGYVTLDEARESAEDDIRRAVDKRLKAARKIIKLYGAYM